jgi:two-component system LytT family response regulator
MKVIIIEDEIDAGNVLAFLIKELFPDINIIGHVKSVTQAREMIKKNEPDLVFLDIQLEDGSGFELFRYCENFNFQVIITTAYSQFAIKAIKNDAIDYLLKPIDPTELKIAVNKANERINNFKQIKVLHDKLLREVKTEEKKIIVKTGKQTYVILLKDIIRLEASGSYTNIITTKESILVSKNIKHYQKLLDIDNFLRPHQSHLVNKNHILEMNNGKLLLSNNEKIPVSFRKKAFIRKQLKKI